MTNTFDNELTHVFAMLHPATLPMLSKPPPSTAFLNHFISPSLM